MQINDVTQIKIRTISHNLDSIVNVVITFTSCVELELKAM